MLRLGGLGGLATQPLFRSHGRKVIAFFCAWELVALVPHSPVPTISATVDRHPWFGMLLLAALAHHWFAEASTIEGLVTGTLDP